MKLRPREEQIKAKRKTPQVIKKFRRKTPVFEHRTDAQSNKIDDVTQEALQCMRSLSEAVTNGMLSPFSANTLLLHYGVAIDRSWKYLSPNIPLLKFYCV
jgi:hypothetical protein